MSDVLVLRYASEVTIIRGDPPTQIIQNTPVSQIVIQREGIPGPRGPRGLPGGGVVVDGDWGDVVITGAGTDDEHWAVPDLVLKAELTGAEFTGPVEVPPEPYAPEWQDSTEAATKGDLFVKLEEMATYGGVSINAFEFDFSTAVTVPPGVHQVRLNHSSANLTSKIWVDHETNSGFDPGLFLNIIEPGDFIFLQDKVDSTTHHKYEALGPAVNEGTYSEIPVSWVDGAGDFVNKKSTIFAIVQPEVEAPVPVWGGIVGDIEDQADLQAALAEKVDSGDIFTADEAGVVPASGGGEEKFMRADGTWAVPLQPILFVQEIAFIIDAGNNPIQTGPKGDLHIPFDCEVLGWTVLGDQVGNISVDIEREILGSFPPDQADDITGTNPPKLINQSSASGDATSWLSTIVANSVLRYRVTSADTVKRVTISLTVEKVL